MKDATLAQGNQIMNLILQKRVPASQIQELFSSGLLTDLLEACIQGVDRNAFRVLLGYRPWGVVYVDERRLHGKQGDPGFETNNACGSKRSGCQKIATHTATATGTMTNGEHTTRVICCGNPVCVNGAKRKAAGYLSWLEETNAGRNER